MITSMSDSTKIGVFVHLLDIIIKVCRYFPIISLFLASLNLLLAVNDFLANSIGFGILHSLFAIGGFIFLAQMHQIDKVHPFEFRSSYNKIKKTSIVGRRSLK
ncbi:MAG: hypothetical protein JHC41_06485 [Nitrosopumilus sp.]|nr:hypothetical protein [Nitrosopumilus sp.]